MGNSISNNSMFPLSNNNFMGFQSNPAQSGNPLPPVLKDLDPLDRQDVGFLDPDSRGKISTKNCEKKF